MNLRKLAPRLVDLPLYGALEVDTESLTSLHARPHATSADLYCVDCGKPSVFEFQPTSFSPCTHDGASASRPNAHPSHLQRLLEPHTLLLDLRCSRDTRHVAALVFRYRDGSITKIGEFPSRRDRAGEELREFRKELSSSDYLDLNAAVGLDSHGVGAGALVYLRRIFERRLAKAALQRKESDPSWDFEAWRYRRVDDKIKELGEELPPSLVRNKQVYGVLSKGIHELEEDECRTHFALLRACVEAILEEEIEERRRERRADEIAKELANLSSKLV